VFDSSGERFDAEQYDDSAGRIVLSYASRDRALERLEAMFLRADPAFFFCHDDQLEAVTERVREYDDSRAEYLQRLQERKESARGLGWYLAGSPPLFEVERTELIRAYAPVVSHREDGTFYLHQSPR